MPEEPTADGFPEESDESPETVAAVFAELERVLGPQGSDDPASPFPWILPIAGAEEVVALLRGAPSGIGAAGLADYLRDRLGTLSGLRAVSGEGGDRDRGV